MGRRKFRPEQALVIASNVDPFTFTYPDTLYVVIPKTGSVFVSLTLMQSDVEGACYPIKIDPDDGDVFLGQEVSTGEPFQLSVNSMKYVDKVSSALELHKYLSEFFAIHPSQLGLVPHQVKPEANLSAAVIDQVGWINGVDREFSKTLLSQLPMSWCDAGVGWFAPNADPTKMGTLYTQHGYSKPGEDGVTFSLTSNHPRNDPGAYFSWHVVKVGFTGTIVKTSLVGNREEMVSLANTIIESNSSALMVETALTLSPEKMRDAIKKHNQKVAIMAARPHFEDKAARVQPKLVGYAIEAPRETFGIKVGFRNSDGSSYFEQTLDSWLILGGIRVEPLLGAIVINFNENVSKERRIAYAQAILANLNQRNLGKVLISNDDDTRLVVTKKPEVIQAHPAAFDFEVETTFTLVELAS